MGIHTVEKIGGTSMSRFGELLENIFIGSRKGDELYNRIFVVSAYGGVTNMLLEDKKTGEPGIYGSFVSGKAGEWQSKLETQIALLKQTILDAKIIDTRHMDTSTVQIMATVGLKNTKNGMEMKYTIVSATEADHRAGKISVETPIAQGLLGKKVGETATIRVPQGEIQLEITSISYDI